MTPNQTAPAPRKWDAEIITARQHDDWIQFETDIHKSAAIRARVARALGRRDRHLPGLLDPLEFDLDHRPRQHLIRPQGKLPRRKHRK